MGAVMERNLSGRLVPVSDNTLSMTPGELQKTLASRLHDIDPETGKTNMAAIADNVISLAKRGDKLGLDAAVEVMDRVLGKSRLSIETLSMTASLSDYLDRLGRGAPVERDIIDAEGL